MSFVHSGIEGMKEGMRMKQKLTVCLLTVMMCIMTSCESAPTQSPELDEKPSETGTTVSDVIGDDAQSAETTVADDESTEDEQTSSKDENASATTDNGGGNQSQQQSSEEATTTKKQESTTTKQQPTTTKQQPTTTKQQPTTTKQQPTTTRQQPTTTKQESTTGGGFTPSGAIDLSDMEVSEKESLAADTICKSIITDKMNEYDRVKAIHDWLVKNVNYDLNESKNIGSNPSAHKAEGALYNKLAVCDGYAKAFELLCAKAGVQAYMMYGEAGNETDGWEHHAWNVVRIGGEWYHIDCTWDDPLVNNQLITDGSNLIYKYFLLTDSEMYIDHKLDGEYTEKEKTCTSTLFKGYGEKLSVDVLLSRSANSKRVTTSSEFCSAVTDWVASKTLKFAIAVPASAGVDGNTINTGIYNGLVAGEFYGVTASASYITHNVGSYVVYIITVTMQ